MTDLEISFSNFLVQRLTLCRFYGYPVFHFPKWTVHNKPDGKVHFIQEVASWSSADFYFNTGVVSTTCLEMFSLILFEIFSSLTK